MRAISPISNYSIQLFEAIPKRGMDSSGTVIEYSDSKPVLAQFARGGLTEWEQLEALELFDFSGLPDGVNPLTRVSVFDTEGYVQRFPKEEREAALAKIDARLEELAERFPSEFRIVAKPRQIAPWPTFDNTPLEDEVSDETGEVTPGILTLQKVSGWSPEQIRLYEVENQNRPEVIAAMEALEADAAGKAAEEAISVVV
jgi:hypothetical protein